MFKNAFISVSNKEGLVSFVRPLVEKGMRVVSTGGTARLLKKSGLPVFTVEKETGFEEVMGGRVKSLHPRIYMPLLARLNHPGDEKTLKSAGLSPFDLVVCNLYPFEKKSQERDQNPVEWIDVGGPSLLRAAAKNFERITVLCNPSDYQPILSAKKAPSFEKRKKLASKAFSLLADYNLHIATWMKTGKAFLKPKNKTYVEKSETLSEGSLSYSLQDWIEKEKCHFEGSFYKNLIYGENPDQKAGWFQMRKTGLHQAQILQGKKELSFNNICDLDSALGILREFSEPCSVAIKHNNPCGVACGNNLENAIHLCLNADPVSVFGAVLALNRPVSLESAESLSSLFLSLVIAPDYTADALKLFKDKKKKLCIMKWPDGIYKNPDQIKARFVEGGLLAQEKQKIIGNWQSNWQCIGNKPDFLVKAQLLMAWKICTHLKSNAIALVSNGQTVGLGMGQVSRISAVETAIQRWKTFHTQIYSPVLASDGFFPFPDSIEACARAGIKWIIQPGGSFRDQEVFSKAETLAVNIVNTGQRCFSH